MHPLCAVGIDIGSSNTKVVVVALDDGSNATREPGGVRELAVRVLPTPSDVRRLRDEVCLALHEVLTDAPSAPVALGIASMAESGVALSAQGEPLMPLLRWADGTEREEAVFDRLGRAELAEATGVPPMAKAPLAAWAWLRLHRAELWQQTSHWGSAADVLCLELTDELVTDHTLAARTLAYRMPSAGDPLPPGFDADILAEVGLVPAQLPRVARPGAAAGHVTARASEATGLPRGLPVFVAGHDHAVAAWAAGARSAGDEADSIGTAESLLRVLASPADRAAVTAQGMTVSRTVTGDRELLGAGMAAGAVIALWPELAPDAAPFTQVAAAMKAEAAADAEPSSLTVLPYPAGRASPEPDPSARFRVLDETGAECDPRTVQPHALGAAILEGLSMQLRWLDDEQRLLTSHAAGSDEGAQRAGSLIVVGGPGAANPAWLRIKAAVLGRPLRPIATREPVAAGAALLAAVRAGYASPRLVLPLAPGIEPQPTASGRHGQIDAEPTARSATPNDPYRHAYKRFVAAATTKG